MSTQSHTPPQLASLANVGSNYLVAGVEGRRMGTAHASIVPYQAFASRDGYVHTHPHLLRSLPCRHLVVGALNNGQFAKLCHVLGRRDLALDARFASNPLRVKHRTALISDLSALFASNTTAHWLALIEPSGLPCAPVNSIGAAFSDPHVTYRGLVQTVQHSTLGPVKMVGPPVQYSRTPAAIQSAPPRLNEHATHVLTHVLEYDAATIQDLTQQGAFGKKA